jgi:hypothetical protein
LARPGRASGRDGVLLCVCLFSFLIVGCHDPKTAQLNANIDAYNRWVVVTNNLTGLWRSYQTADDPTRKVESLKQCLAAVEAADFTTGSENDLGIFPALNRWKQQRIGQLNAYINATGAWNSAKWDAVKQWDEEVHKAELEIEHAKANLTAGRL